jgi:hypothetical protein
MKKVSLLPFYSSCILNDWYNNCLDIDECLTSVCGNETFNNCTNFSGFYKCACGKGYVAAENGKGCVGM